MGPRLSAKTLPSQKNLFENSQNHLATRKNIPKQNHPTFSYEKFPFHQAQILHKMKNDINTITEDVHNIV